MVLSIILGVGLAVVAFIIGCTMAPKGWRTRVSNTVSAIAAVALPISQKLVVLPWLDLIDNVWTAIAMVVAVNVLNTVLRQFTNTQAGKAV